MGSEETKAEAQLEETNNEATQGGPEREAEQLPDRSKTEEEERIDAVEELRQQAEEWRSKADELLDKYRRSVAEFSNYRKRQDRDRDQQMLRLSMQVMRQLLPIMDDFERALQETPDGLGESGWLEGIVLIDRKLKALLTGFQVVPIEALGKPFNPAFHSALMQEESDEHPEGTVTEELRKGYLLSDQVLRPTLVKVSCKPAPKAETPSSESESE